MNSTEQKIREAFEKYLGGYDPEEYEVAYLDFKAGYMALLNDLKSIGVWDNTTYYVLPEGVGK